MPKRADYLLIKLFGISEQLNPALALLLQKYALYSRLY
jgi:hypothetical protein